MPEDDELIDRILDGETSDEEAAEFQKWLEAPENLESFARRAELHTDLRRSLRRRNIQSNALDASDEEGTNDASAVSAQAPSPATRLPRMWVLTLTGLATAACILIAFAMSGGNRNPATATAPTASVVSSVQGRLTKDGAQWNDSKLPAGGYELQQGLLNLQFGGGVMVYVEAPARFEAVSSKRIVLHSGRLSARVPPEGIGFTVETPEAEVVDFGTEFSVDVEGGASEVHVFDGLVRVHPGTSKQRDAKASVDLQASQAVRITDGAAEPVDISIANDRFIRDFDEPKRKYVRSLKRLSPLAFYRMPIRDRGLIAEPSTHSGVVLTGEGRRPPHARGVFVGGSLRVGADSSGRGGRVDFPPAMNTGRFSLIAFVYLETPAPTGIVATNLQDARGSFGLSLTENGTLQADIRNSTGDMSSVTGDSVLPLKSWRQVVVTVDGSQLRLYEDGRLVASEACPPMAATNADVVWFGTDASSTRVWNGRIDELALFDRALSEDEIAALHRAALEEIARSK